MKRAGVASVLCILWSLASGAWAAPPPPPGGHLPIHRGGDNRPGYPPLVQRVDVTPGAPVAGATLDLTCAPNPFRASTHFRFELRPGEAARVRVFTLEGRQVRAIPVDSRSGGPQQIAWDGRDQRGRRLRAGMYVVRVEAGVRSASTKVVFVR